MSLSTANELGLALGLVVFAAGCGESTLLEQPEPSVEAHACEVGASLGLTALFDFEAVRTAQFYYFANPEDPQGHTDVEPPGSDPNSTALVEVDRCAGTAAATSCRTRGAGEGCAGAGGRGGNDLRGEPFGREWAGGRVDSAGC